MNVRALITPRQPEAFPDWRFQHLDIEYEADTQSVWMNYKADAPHCYTLRMLQDLIEFRDSLRSLFNSGLTQRRPIRYLVMASNKPGVFSLGGDLITFAAAIRKHDTAALTAYAHACVDLVYSYSQGINLPIVTLSAVHGQCLGGALEAALAFDFILAEEGAKFGVPEVMFNTFPGMGAVTLLTRRVGPAMTEKIISEGRTYSGREMHDLEVIDLLAPGGEVRRTARAWMLDDAENRWRRRRVFTQERRRCFPVSREELFRITDLWAECSSRIEEHDLRYMERLVKAQKRLLDATDAKVKADCLPSEAATSQ
jgi:DSF synthase